MSYLKKYEYVIAVTQYGGISQAAEKLGISQPTFSKYLKKIESDLGVELFDRSTLPLRLTAAGECFINTGRQLLDVDRQLTKQLDEIKFNKSAVVRIGISPSRTPYMMPSILALYREKNPSSRVIIEERTTAELNQRLSIGELDLVISLHSEDTDGFEKIELFEESVLLAVAKSKSTDADTARDILMSSPLINIGRGLRMWQMLNDILDEMSIPQPEIECQSIESALALVKRGLGAMIVPSYIAREENDTVRFLSLDGIGGTDLKKRRVCLFYRKEQFLTKAEKDFIDAVITAEKERRESV